MINGKQAMQTRNVEKYDQFKHTVVITVDVHHLAIPEQVWSNGTTADCRVWWLQEGRTCDNIPTHGRFALPRFVLMLFKDLPSPSQQMAV